MNAKAAQRSRLQNAAQTVLLLGGLMGLLGVIGWLLGGPLYGLVAMALVLVLYLFNPQIPPAVILRLYRAERLDRMVAPALFPILDELSARAGLRNPPDLYYLPTPLPSAFSVGDRDRAAIAVSDGMLRRLGLRELVGVLAHEVSHIAHNDLRTMTFADFASRVTQILTLFGLFLLALNLPLLWLGQATVNFGAILILIFAPVLSALLQLALSRSREYQADLGAAALTGDPVGLARALALLEPESVSPWARWWRTTPEIRREPSMLRTHPPSEKRIERLLALHQESGFVHRIPLQAYYDPWPFLQPRPQASRWPWGSGWY